MDISAHRMQVALEFEALQVDATPSSSLDWCGVGWGMLAFVELGAIEVGATPSFSLDWGGVGRVSVR